MDVQEYRSVLQGLLEDAFPQVPIDWDAPSSAETFRVLQGQRRWVYGEVLLSLEELVTVKRALYDAAFSAAFSFPVSA